MSKSKNAYTINLPYVDRNSEIFRVMITFDEDKDKVIGCRLPSGKRLPFTDEMKEQLRNHIKNCSVRY